MFKPLLKSIPSLSGNMKIVCNLEGYNTDSSNKFIYNCNVNNAYLTSISSNLYDKNIPLNLKNNSFEYDIKKFYLYYADVFYKNSFNYSKINIPIIDFTNTINNSNSDFKYGCKRVSYLKSGNQLAFYAPIYIENVDDLKGKYFIISCTFNKVYKLTKYIKIKISNINDGNSLADYLVRYANKIDDKVIYCSNSYKNIYYGIDVRNGGFIKVEDNISSNLYNKYFTINDFDATLNNGFQRNYMMMKQVIPLSFYFDPNNLLYDFEKSVYNNAEVIINGRWYDENDKEIPFYDFSDDYSKFEEDIYNLYYENIFKYISTDYNIMDLRYPACNEASSENYKYVNTVAKNYNRWKLKYSNDDYPYIINNNFAFSFNQGSLYTYKEFPIMYSPIRAYAKLVSNTEYNMLFDYNDVYQKNDFTVINNKKKYFDLYNKNFIANFFDVFVKKDHTDDYIDIFGDLYKGYWTNVSSDGKVYHKGILYDLNTIYGNNLNMDFKIDKFGVFIKPIFDYTLARDFNDLYKESRNVFSYNFTNSTNYYDLDQIYNYHQLDTKYSYLLNYSVVKKDNDGPYVDINAIEDFKKQYDEGNNQYIDVNDVYIMNLIRNNKKIDLSKPLIINNQEIYLSIIDGYKLIEVHNVKNILDDYFKDLITDFNQPNKKNNDGIIFRSRKFIEIEDIYWAIDKLYFSIYPNKTKYSLIDNYSLLKNVEEGINISLYYKTKFLKYDDTTKVYLDRCNISENDLEKLYKYFYTNGLYDRKNKILYTSPIFRQLNNITNTYGHLLSNDDKNIIYIDPYNLDEVYKVYLYKEYDCSDNDLVPYYCNFLNMDHIRLYFEKLYKGHDLSGNISIDDIYIKVRNFNNIIVNLEDSVNTNFSTITIQDDYIPISNFGLKTIGEISFYIGYNEVLECFYFNDDYFTKFIEPFNRYQEIETGDNSISKEEIMYALNKKSISDSKYKYWAKIFVNLTKYNIKNFEICFRKNMLKLNSDLYNLIINRENDAIFKDLYLYHIQNPKDYKAQLHYIDEKKYQIDGSNNIHVSLTFGHDGDGDFTKNITNIGNTEYLYPVGSPYFKMIYGSGIDDTLVPYFKEVYEEGRTETNIYSDYFINNIIPTSNGNETRYKYNEPSINFLAYIPKDVELSDNITQSQLEEHRYSLVNDVSDSFVTSSEFVTYNVCANPENINEFSNLITYNYNGTYYGFYMINSYFDNTNNTINIQNEDLDYINCVDYINGIHVTDINENSYSYLNGMYKNILPYFKASNPVKFVMNNIDTLIKPQIYKLKNNIKQYPNIDGNYAYSYTLYTNKKDSYIELSRYFDSIVPYTPEVQYLNSYCLYYKDTNKIIENELSIKREPYIMYKEHTNINRFSYISYFDLDRNVKKFEPTEYKYYNYNRFFNLEKEFVISINQEFNEQGIIDFENDENKIFELFINYINNTKFDALPYKDKINNYLFLYKKYRVKFIQDFKYIDSSNSKVYKLKIKFSLL